MYIENIFIWSNNMKSYYDDYETIRQELENKLKDKIELYNIKLVKDLGTIKEYKINYAVLKKKSRSQSFAKTL